MAPAPLRCRDILSVRERARGGGEGGQGMDKKQEYREYLYQGGSGREGRGGGVTSKKFENLRKIVCMILLSISLQPRTPSLFFLASALSSQMVWKHYQ